MIYKFLDDKGTFTINNPHKYNLYFPLTNRYGSLLSSIGPYLSGDIKKDNERFLTLPASFEDLRSSPLCIREFFIHTPGEVIRLSRPYKDTQEAGFLYQKIIKRTKSLDIEVVNFIPFDIDAEVMWIKVKNTAKKTMEITPTSFIPLYGRSEKNLRDHRHVSSLLNRVELRPYGVYLKPTMIFDEKGHKSNKDIYFALGYENNCQAPVGQFPTLDYFFGEAGIFYPSAIYSAVKPVTKERSEFDGKEACASFRFASRKLKPQQEANYFIILGINSDPAGINKLFNKLNSLTKIKTYFQRTKDFWVNYLSEVQFDFKNRDFNNWLLWVKLQPTLRKLFGCSFLPHFDYGKGGRGWRDLWQDALTLLLTEPQKAKDLILTSFKGVRLDGSNATIITKQGGFIADRNRISRVWMDHGIWPYLTTKFYLNRTNDLGLLLEEAPYFRDHQLRRAKEIDGAFSQKGFIQLTKAKKAYKGSILEHILIQNLIQFFNVGSHNIVRLENADWNDGLDMASDNGESVAFSFMYAHNLKDICVFLEQLKEKQDSVELLDELKILIDTKFSPVNYSDYRARQKRMKLYFDRAKQISGKKIKIKIDDLILDLRKKSDFFFLWLSNKEWNREGFFNGYYDNKGRPVEGKNGAKIRIMLPSQVFAIMSTVADSRQVKAAWNSIKRYLQDKKLGGFRLNSNLQDIDLELGRAFGFSYGDKENGAFFSHMNVMLANALYKRGFIKEGHEVINSIYKMATSQSAQINPCLPEYFNSQGRGLYLYLTGSASWYVYTLMEEILGIKFDQGNIVLEPKLIPANFYNARSIETRFFADNKRIKLIYERAQVSNKSEAYHIKTVFLNQKAISNNLARAVIKTSALHAKENIIRVKLF